MAAPEPPGPGSAWPISYRDVLQARDRIRPHLPKTPLRAYPSIDAEVGRGIRVFVKHERSEEHTSELQSLAYLVCRLLLEKKKPGWNHRELRLELWRQRRPSYNA